MNERWVMMVISHTHWDREWYLPFQAFRLRLVAMATQLLQVLAKERDYRYFLLDGQTIILEDLAEVSPPLAEALGEHLRAGRIQFGPWYVVPDEFLVSGEALVRNLMLGEEVGARYGPVMKVGYQPDAFGHIAQLPQILRGFGIDSAVLWRGVPGEIRNTEFRWQAPDGSEVLVVYLAFAYGNAAGLPSEPDQLQPRLHLIRQNLEPWATTRYLLLMNGGDHAWPQPDLPLILQRANSVLTDARVVHSNIVEYIEAVRVVERAGQARPWPLVQGELRSGERTHILPGVLSARGWIKQRNAACQNLLERWAEPFTAWTWLVSGQPPVAEADALVWRAWRYLLLNHPHDSICGCGVDQVHEEMRVRFDWAAQIGDEVAEAALTALAGQIGTSVTNLPSNEVEAMPVLIFNATGGPCTDFVSVTVPAPAEANDYALADSEGHFLPYQMLGQRQTEIWGSILSRSELLGFLSLVGGGLTEWDREKILGLESMLGAMLGERATEAVISRVDVRPDAPGAVAVEVGMAQFGEHNFEAIGAGLREVAALADRGDVQTFHLRVRRLDEVEIGLVARAVPPFGYCTYYLLPGHRRPAHLPAPVPTNFIENRYLSVQADIASGTLTVIDKESGSVFEGLNRFVDEGDAGDEYNYSPPTQNLVVDAPVRPPRISLTEDGPVRWTLRVEQTLALPVELAEDRQSRSAKRVDCSVISVVTLYRDVRRVDIRTEVDNQARDHRLRVVFPTRLTAESSHAGGQFAAIERPIALPHSTERWLEQPSGTHPMQDFVAVQSGGVGMLVAARGLAEYEVVPGGRGVSVALTLLRGVGWLSREDLVTRKGHAGPALPTPDAQCPGSWTFEYALVPYTGTWEASVLQAQAFINPMEALAVPLNDGPLPPRQSFLEVSPPSLVVSAIKRPRHGEGLVVRLYNLRSQGTTGVIRLFQPFRQAELASLGEERTGQILAEGTDTIHLEVGGHQIVTLYLSF